MIQETKLISLIVSLIKFIVQIVIISSVPTYRVGAISRDPNSLYLVD